MTVLDIGPQQGKYKLKLGYTILRLKLS